MKITYLVILAGLMLLIGAGMLTVDNRLENIGERIESTVKDKNIRIKKYKYLKSVTQLNHIVSILVILLIICVALR